MACRSTGGRNTRPVATGTHVALLTLTLALAACQEARPDFAQRSREDCARGDRDACRMLDAMAPPRIGNPQVARPSRVEADVAAIIRGMEQARSELRMGAPDNTPPQAEPSRDGPAQAEPSADGPEPDRPATRTPLPQLPGVP